MFSKITIQVSQSNFTATDDVVGEALAAVYDNRALAALLDKDLLQHVSTLQDDGDENLLAHVWAAGVDEVDEEGDDRLTQPVPEVIQDTFCHF